MFRLTILLLISPLITFSCPPVFQPVPDSRETPQEYFLPKNVVPYRYTIFIEPNLEEETIEGSVEIELEVLENTNNITIEIRSIEIDNGSVVVTRAKDGTEVEHGDPLWKEDVEHYVINLKEDLVQGENYTLTIGKYSGKLHTDNGGFYLAKYVDEDGIERWAYGYFHLFHLQRTTFQQHQRATTIESLIKDNELNYCSNMRIPLNYQNC